MEKFLAWEGWTGIGALAQLLALVTLIAAVWRFLVLRRQVPLFQLTWAFIGTAPVGGDVYHVVEFHNVGRGTGHFLSLHLYGASPKLTSDHRVPKAIGSGDRFQLLVTSPDLDVAWVRYGYRTHDDRSRWYLCWESLAPSGSRADEWDQDIERWRVRPYLERYLDWYRAVPIAPGGVPRATIRSGIRGTRYIEGRLGGANGELGFPAIAAAYAVAPLPYVGPPLR